MRLSKRTAVIVAAACVAGRGSLSLGQTFQTATFTVSFAANDPNASNTVNSAITQANAYNGSALFEVEGPTGQLTGNTPALNNPNTVIFQGFGNQAISGARGSDASTDNQNFTGATPGDTTLSVTAGSLTLTGLTISGGNSGNDYVAAGAFVGENLSGGIGVAFQSSGVLSNVGSIVGGTGGFSYESSGDGGAGVTSTAANALINNTGKITGGNAGGGNATGNGGAGVQLNAFGSVINSGSVIGGNASDANGGTPGNGGAGFNFTAGGSLTSSGAITGGNGGGDETSQPAGSGGAAVSFSGGGSVINSGTITAGTGGNGGTNGAEGAAITITGGVGTFTNQNHGVINGNVTLGNYANNLTLQIGSKINGNLNASLNSNAVLTLTDDGSGGTQIYSAVANSILFVGQLIKAGTGTWVLDQSLSYIGGTVLNAGTLSVSRDVNLGTSGTLGFNGGILEITGTGYTSTSRAISWGANGGGIDVDNAGNTFTVTQSLSNGGTLTKLGAGTLVLGGSNDNVGLGAVVNAGTLVLNKSIGVGVHAIGGPGLTINPGAAVQLAGSGGDQIYDGGSVQINAGTFDMNSQSETINGLYGTGTVTNSSNAAISVLAVGSGSFGGTIGTNGNGIALAMNNAGNTFTIAGNTDNGYLGVTVNAGTVVLGKTSNTGVHSVGGGLTINAGGTAQLGGNGGDQIFDNNTVTLNGGTFDMNGQSETIGALSGNSGVVTDNAFGSVSTLTISGSGTFGGAITSGAAQLALVKNGNSTFTLNGSSINYTGRTTISAGTLAINGSIASTAITLDGSTSFASLKLLSANALRTNASLMVNSADAPTIVLDFNGNQTVATLQINGMYAPPGIYSTGNEPTADPSLFATDPSFNGTLTVAVPEPSLAGVALLTTAGLIARRRRTR